MVMTSQYTSSTLPPADACDLASGNFTGKIVVIRRGTCLFSDKLNTVAKYGAVAVVFYDNVEADDVLLPSITNNGDMPSFGIRQADGIRLVDEILNSSPVLVQFSADPLVLRHPNGGRISAFSSIGPASNLVLKPYVLNMAHKLIAVT